MEQGKKAVFIILVAGRRQKDALLAALHDAGVNLINVTYGKGAVKENFLKNILGLVAEENKVIINCITTCAKAEAVMQLLVDKFNFDKQNTGIAFTVPIEAVSY